MWSLETLRGLVAGHETTVWIICLALCFSIASSTFQLNFTLEHFQENKEDNLIVPLRDDSNCSVAPSSNKSGTDTTTDASTATSRKAKHHVHFPLIAEEPIPNDLIWASQMEDEEKRQLWWRQKDFDKFKRASRMLSTQLQVADASHPTPFNFSNVVMKLFERCCNAETDYLGVTSEKDRRPLDRWMGTGRLRVGLEKSIVRTMAHGCSALRGQLIHSVLEAQKASQGDCDSIRTASFENSRPARLFATVIGQSIAASCATDQQLPNDDNLSFLDQTIKPV